MVGCTQAACTSRSQQLRGTFVNFPACSAGLPGCLRLPSIAEWAGHPWLACQGEQPQESQRNRVGKDLQRSSIQASTWGSSTQQQVEPYPNHPVQIQTPNDIRLPLTLAQTPENPEGKAAGSRLVTQATVSSGFMFWLWGKRKGRKRGRGCLWVGFGSGCSCPMGQIQCPGILVSYLHLHSQRQQWGLAEQQRVSLPHQGCAVQEPLMFLGCHWRAAPQPKAKWRREGRSEEFREEFTARDPCWPRDTQGQGSSSESPSVKCWWGQGGHRQPVFIINVNSDNDDSRVPQLCYDKTRHNAWPNWPILNYKHMYYAMLFWGQLAHLKFLDSHGNSKNNTAKVKKKKKSCYSAVSWKDLLNICVHVKTRTSIFRKSFKRCLNSYFSE